MPPPNDPNTVLPHDIAMEDGFCDLCEEELQQAFELEEAEEVAQA